jgi:hypothetical protein
MPTRPEANMPSRDEYLAVACLAVVRERNLSQG